MRDFTGVIQSSTQVPFGTFKVHISSIISSRKTSFLICSCYRWFILWASWICILFCMQWFILQMGLQGPWTSTHASWLKSQLHGCWTTGLAPIAVLAGIPEREGFLSLASDVPTNGHICFTSAILWQHQVNMLLPDRHKHYRCLQALYLSRLDLTVHMLSSSFLKIIWLSYRWNLTQF